MDKLGKVWHTDGCAEESKEQYSTLKLLDDVERMESEELTQEDA